MATSLSDNTTTQDLSNFSLVSSTTATVFINCMAFKAVTFFLNKLTTIHNQIVCGTKRVFQGTDLGF